MKKILWLCNVTFSGGSVMGNGSWLQPMAEQLQANSNIQIINITSGDVTEIKQCDYGEIVQYIVPNRYASNNNQFASKRTCEDVAYILNEVKPDIVHIWGTESIWASIYKQGYIKQKALLDIQGLLFAYTDYYYGGLSFTQVLQSVGLKELLMPWRNLFQKKRVFRKRGNAEIECLKSFENIAFQSRWVYDQVRCINEKATYYPTKIMLRKCFYESEPWIFKKSSRPIIFSSASAAVSYKGIHILIQAVSILKKKYPEIQLRLVGKINVGNRLLDGYSIYLKNLIKEYGLESNVVYTGSLDERQIVDELLNCNVCVVPSFIETYCLAFAEAMILGVPTVVSFAGAMPELAEDKKEALFYNSIDFRTCASYINELIEDKVLAESISSNARIRRLVENNPQEVINTQLNIYNEILND